MRVVVDIEANGLDTVTQIWVIVCKDIDTGEYHVFRNPTTSESTKQAFLTFTENVDLWIGHNILGYDCPVLSSLLNFDVSPTNVIDTLIISKLVDYPRDGHSIEDYGLEFGIEKGKFTDFSHYSKEMEDYCVRDVDIAHRVYLKYLRYINNPVRRRSILREHRFQYVINDMHNNGFCFNVEKAKKLLEKVNEELVRLDKEIADAFPPKLKLVREITPRYTQHGTLHRGDFRWVKDGDLSSFNGGPFCLCEWTAFNPSSHKQIIDVLTDAGWSPTEKTATHIELERTLNKLKYQKNRDSTVDIKIKECYVRLQSLQKYGWKIDEINLNTLPAKAPAPARTLARRILIESRRRTLTEWIALVDANSGRIHGKFYGIGAWTHRMAHQKPNTANIPTEKKLYGAEMRSLWCAPRKRLLVGVDAEGIQLRIFAHYIDDPEFTAALVHGKKEDGSDPHSLNRRILGSICQSRDTAKRFIYAYLLGAGIGKLAQILGCSREEGEEALDRLIDRYAGLNYLKTTIIPADAKRGWFTGIDGGAIRIPGDTPSQRKHLCMSGYLQNGEAVVIKEMVLKALDRLPYERYRSILVNVVHDEIIMETPNDVFLAEEIKDIFCTSIREVGEELQLKCPLSGDGHIGLNWKEIH